MTYRRPRDWHCEFGQQVENERYVFTFGGAQVISFFLLSTPKGPVELEISGNRDGGLTSIEERRNLNSIEDLLRRRHPLSKISFCRKYKLEQSFLLYLHLQIRDEYGYSRCTASFRMTFI